MRYHRRYSVRTTAREKSTQGRDNSRLDAGLNADEKPTLPEGEAVEADNKS